MRQITATLAIITSGATAALAASPEHITGPELGWSLLDQVEVREVIKNDIWRAEKTFPEPLMAAAPRFQIEGFYLPIAAQGYVSTFLLVRDPADCPFCGGGGYGPSLEVTVKRPIADRAPYSKITLQGTLELISDPETFMAYRLVDAQVLD